MAGTGADADTAGSVGCYGELAAELEPAERRELDSEGRCVITLHRTDCQVTAPPADDLSSPGAQKPKVTTQLGRQRVGTACGVCFTACLVSTASRSLEVRRQYSTCRATLTHLPCIRTWWLSHTLAVYPYLTTHTP